MARHAACVLVACVVALVTLAWPARAARAVEIVDGLPVHPVRTDAVAADDFADLAALGEAIGDSRIVVLDELTHGEGNVFALKARIVRYLHERKGFDLLVLESGLFDVDRIWRAQQPVRGQVSGNVFYMYADSGEVGPLFDYVDAQRAGPRPLVLAGFDGRLSGAFSRTRLVPQLRARLAAVADADAADTAAWLEQVQRLLDGKLGDAAPEAQAAFLAGSRRVDTLLRAPADAGNDPADAAGFWLRINASLRRMAEVAWGRVPFDGHDEVMAGNLQWLLEQGWPGRKAIVWGHFAHVNRSGGFRDAPVRAGQEWPGHEEVPNLTASLPDGLRAATYVLHFAGAQGRYLDYLDMHPVVVRALPAGLEHRVAAKAGGAGFVDLRGLPASPPAASGGSVLWGIDYLDSMPLDEARRRFDGMLLLDRIVPATYPSRPPAAGN